MSRLMQQVAEMRGRAHVCPRCGGTKTVSVQGADGVFAVYRMLDIPCPRCKGTGKVPAPDADTLCHAIEVLAAAVEAENVYDKHTVACTRCQPYDECNTGKQLRLTKYQTRNAARNLLKDGPQPTSICNSAPEHTT